MPTESRIIVSLRQARLPDGAQARVRLKVADLVAGLAMKGIAIGERYAEKDAYDIYALCGHSRGGPLAVRQRSSLS